MNTRTNRCALLLLAAAPLTSSCDRLSATSRGAAAEASEPVASTVGTKPAASAVTAPTAAGPGVISVGGVAAWDALSPVDKAKLKASPSIYLHQSVGQDLEDGAESIGFKFEYYGPGASSVAAGPNGGLFNDVGPIDNGKPMEKLALVEQIAKRHQGKLKVLAFSFGYADVRDEDLAKVEAEYVRVAGEVRKAGARLLHVTPPLVFDVAENGPKMKMRTWMLSTFASETIFDLQDIESQDGGKRCEDKGVWRICQSNRSTAACPSKGQGVDGDGQGHLCSKKAAVFAKALLFALARAGG